MKTMRSACSSSSPARALPRPKPCSASRRLGAELPDSLGCRLLVSVLTRERERLTPLALKKTLPPDAKEAPTPVDFVEEARLAGP